MECFANKWRTGMLILGSAGMAALSLWLYQDPEVIFYKRWMCGIVGLLFGFGVIFEIYQLFKFGPLVIINENGFEDRRTKFGVIPWSDISEISLLAIEKRRFLCLHVKDKEKYRDKLSAIGKKLLAINEAMGIPGLAIRFVGLSETIDDVHDYILDNFPQYERLHENWG